MRSECPRHISQNIAVIKNTHPLYHQLTAMTIRNLLILVIIVGSLLALIDISSGLPASRRRPQRRATTPTTSAPTKTAIRQYMVAPKRVPKSRQSEAEVVTCKVILWKLFCSVKIRQKTPIKRKASYNRNRGMLGLLFRNRIT